MFIARTQPPPASSRRPRSRSCLHSTIRRSRLGASQTRLATPRTRLGTIPRHSCPTSRCSKNSGSYRTPHTPSVVVVVVVVVVVAAAAAVGVVVAADAAVGYSRRRRTIVVALHWERMRFSFEFLGCLNLILNYLK